nr:MAG: hypothetical protein [Bacteriophage sp.]
MDTKSYYVNSPINSLNYIAVGWSWNLSQIPYLYWGGDNTDSGAECVMFNIESMIDLEDKMPDIMKMNLCANHFNLYKYTRDADDDIRKELSDLKAELAVTKAIRPYQDKLIQCEMEKMFTAGINYTDRKTCNVIYGVVTLPNEPTVTGLVGRNAYGCLPCGFTQPASGTPAQ